MAAAYTAQSSPPLWLCSAFPQLGSTLPVFLAFNWSWNLGKLGPTHSTHLELVARTSRTCCSFPYLTLRSLVFGNSILTWQKQVPTIESWTQTWTWYMATGGPSLPIPGSAVICCAQKALCLMDSTSYQPVWSRLTNQDVLPLSYSIPQHQNLCPVTHKAQDSAAVPCCTCRNQCWDNKPHATRNPSIAEKKG